MDHYNAIMKWLYSLGCQALLVVSLFLFPIVAQAHPLDVAYMDFGKTADGTLKLTVAVHPYQAYEIVRAGSTSRFDLQALQKNGDLISAYIQDRISVSRGDVPCTWSAGTASTPPTELEALGDGVTVSGTLSCTSDSMKVTARSDVFDEEFPTQTTILRLELPDGYADRATTDSNQRTGTIDLTEIFSTSSTESLATGTAMMSRPPRRPDAPEAEIAQRFLDPGLGLWGAIGILLAAILVGALHALGPGHGKSLLAATLIGERATLRNVLSLGTVMTATHVADVFLMSIAAGFISAILPPTQLLNWLQVLSAIGLAGFGLWNLRRAVIQYRLVRGNATYGESDEAHRRAHELGMPHTHGAAEHHHHHHHHHHEKKSFRSVLWLGFVGSLAPCPTAWAIFMATLSVGRPGAGLLLLVAFTIGLYATILTIGILLVTSSKFAARHTPPKLTYALPVISALIVTGLGIGLLVNLVR